MKAKKMAMVMAAIALVGAVGIGSTLAYLTDSTATITNTFTVGNVNISLTESQVDYVDGVGYVDIDNLAVEDGSIKAQRTIDASSTNQTNAYRYNLVPGDQVYKDPTVTVNAGSEACYVFVKVTGLDDDIPFAVDTTVWTAVTGVDNVYVKEVADAASAIDLAVFASNTVTYNVNATNDTEVSNIVIQAAAVQKDHVANVATAYAQISGNFQ